MASGTNTQSDDALESHVRAPTTDKPNTKRVNFSVDTTKADVFKAEDDDDLNTYLKVPVSSLNEDRDGDEIADDGMESLLAQVSDEPVGLFPNHGMDPGTAMYDFREVFGAWEDGEMDGDRTFGTVRLKRVSPDSEELVDDAKDLVNSIEQNMPVGFSIGFGWDDKDAEELDSGGMRFHDLDLMEISAVGIPSNPSAVVQAGTEIAGAVKAAGADPTQLDTDTLTKSLQASMSTKESDDDEDDEEQESKQGEIGDAAVVDFAATAFDGVDASDLASVVDENDAEFIGVDQGDLASLLAAFAEASEGDANDAITQLIEMEDSEAETDEGDTGDDDEDEEEMEGVEDEIRALRETVEEQRTELESLKSDVADSAGRKGGMNPADDEPGDDPDAETDGAEPANEYEEALAFSGGGE